MLAEEFLNPLGISQVAFARRIGVTPARLNEIVTGKRGVTVDIAVRFARALNVSPSFWLNCQMTLDLYSLQHSAAAKEIRRIKPIAV